MDTTAQAVACRWCGQAAQVKGDDGWICDECFGLEKLVNRVLWNWGKSDDKALKWKAIGTGLTMRWARRDEKDVTFRLRCPHCTIEVSEDRYGPACHCGYDGREG